MLKNQEIEYPYIPEWHKFDQVYLDVLQTAHELVAHMERPDAKEAVQFSLSVCIRLGIHNTELARYLEVETSSISRWLLGKCVPPRHSRKYLVDCIGELLSRKVNAALSGLDKALPRPTRVRQSMTPKAPK